MYNVGNIGCQTLHLSATVRNSFQRFTTAMECLCMRSVHKAHVKLCKSVSNDSLYRVVTRYMHAQHVLGALPVHESASEVNRSGADAQVVTIILSSFTPLLNS